MTDLLDVNLLIALAWPNHVHHVPALRWFRGRGDALWATTPVTESGFIRVSCNAATTPAAVAPTAALGLLERMYRLPGHVFLADDVALLVGSPPECLLAPQRVVTYRQVTDAHLIALARRHGVRLATFDRGLAALVAGSPDVLLVPPR